MESNESAQAAAWPLYPYVLAETENFAAVFKPPRMHSAPLGRAEGGSLLEWYARRFPGVMGLRGRKECEGGLAHRLDYETSGLALLAKTQKALDSLLAQQAAGAFVKEYCAICRKGAAPPPGYPPPPSPERASGKGQWDREIAACGAAPFPSRGFPIESFFRPYGPGRKQVRPALEGARGEIARDRGGYYRTEIFQRDAPEPGSPSPLAKIAARLSRGFRHQVRCHLAWIGLPILNDPLYGARPETAAPPSPAPFMALRATALLFGDPETGALREYRVPALEYPAIYM